jgi:hypothetical protein
LVGVAPIFAQKSRAALTVVYYAVIGRGFSHPSDIFDSHRPLHFQPSLANASQLGFLPRIRQNTCGRWPALTVFSTQLIQKVPN